VVCSKDWDFARSHLAACQMRPLAHPTTLQTPAHRQRMAQLTIVLMEKADKKKGGFFGLGLQEEELEQSFRARRQQCSRRLQHVEDAAVAYRCAHCAGSAIWRPIKSHSLQELAPCSTTAHAQPHLAFTRLHLVSTAVDAGFLQPHMRSCCARHMSAVRSMPQSSLRSSRPEKKRVGGLLGKMKHAKPFSKRVRLL